MTLEVTDMTVYMLTDDTKYRLPLYVTDNIHDLSRFSGQSVKRINDLIKKAEKRGGTSRYVKIELEDE